MAYEGGPLHEAVSHDLERERLYPFRLLVLLFVPVCFLRRTSRTFSWTSRRTPWRPSCSCPSRTPGAARRSSSAAILARYEGQCADDVALPAVVEEMRVPSTCSRGTRQLFVGGIDALVKWLRRDVLLHNGFTSFVARSCRRVRRLIAFPFPAGSK